MHFDLVFPEAPNQQTYLSNSREVYFEDRALTEFLVLIISVSSFVSYQNAIADGRNVAKKKNLLTIYPFCILEINTLS